MDNSSAEDIESCIAIIEAELQRLKATLPVQKAIGSADTFLASANIDSVFLFDEKSRSKVASRCACAPSRKKRQRMPDPRLIKRILRNRELRDNHFDAGLFADPAWDMILDLVAAREEHRRISVTSLCVAARVPATTALRWISTLIENGLVERFDDPSDGRRAFVRLSDKGARAAASYFDECQTASVAVV